jgi:elongin-A
MPVDTLVNMSLRACGKIHKRIRDIGALPYSIARPFLLKIDSPEQLYALEANCDQIIGHDGEIWRALIRRDIPNWESKKHEPSDPRNWGEVYHKLKQEADSAMDAGADKLKAALNDKNEKHLAEIKPMSDLARSRGPSVQARVAYRYQSGKTGSRGSSKLGVLEKIKKEARDAKAARAIAEQQLSKRIATTVTRAPAQFVEDVRTQRQNARQSPERAIRAPRPPMAVRRPEGASASPPRIASSPPSRTVAAALVSHPAVTHQQVQEREARLRALNSGKPLPVSNAHSVPPKETSPRKELHVPQKEPHIPSVERPSPPNPAPGNLSASFLEDSGPPSSRKLLGDALARPNSGAGGISRSASPQLASLVRKRKKEPDLFMTPAKRKAVAADGGAALR